MNLQRTALVGILLFAAGCSGQSEKDATSKNCLELVDHAGTNPMALSGKLVVTYNEPTLETTLCEWDESAQTYFCPYASEVAPECEAYDTTYWCPVANPPPEKLGDVQEMGALDLANPEAGVTRWTNNTLHEGELDISPDGTKVLYPLRKKLDDFDNGLGIWITDSDGKNPTRLTPEGSFAGAPTWIPPGNERFTYNTWDGIFVFDLATQVTSQLVPQFAGPIRDPEPSHDGKRIVFKSDVDQENVYGIYVMNFDGSDVKQLTSGFSDHDPVFSPDDKRVYLERYYGSGAWDQYADLERTEHPEINQWGIVQVDVESGEESVVVPHDPCGKHFFWLPTVSPDGEHVMFIHDYIDPEDSYQDLWVTDKDGNDMQSVPGSNGFYWFDWGK